MIVNFICVVLLFCPISASNIYTKRNISREAWSGVDTGIRIGTKFAPVHFKSMMTAMMECAIQCDQTSGCGIFKLEEDEEEGIGCSLAEIQAFTFKESVSSGPGLEVSIRDDFLKQAGNTILTSSYLSRYFNNILFSSQWKLGWMVWVGCLSQC